ncbi:hypothetical protein FZ934_10425 [Rhizobium grahamii]|uniref:Uncharacterized protein n=1 Tax=Rhizobium grahamii TaxID=1120045 RepID=A0A5Q0CAA0_9HYPH|nr:MULTISPECIES: hypothetical protein [Rhizobium]QFY60797.1 hypothetical protein FZ934_10425 [Rhizobium grahamii]QRM50057.1 hypothetical protein F3Y33_12465 [Rhizobium sp. BG6]
MTIQSGSPSAAGIQQTPRIIDAPEFLQRIAEQMRAKSGSDLPLSCYVEQVKLQLASGRSPEELSNLAKGQDNQVNTECYRAWAMPE